MLAFFLYVWWLHWNSSVSILGLNNHSFFLGLWSTGCKAVPGYNGVSRYGVSMKAGAFCFRPLPQFAQTGPRPHGRVIFTGQLQPPLIRVISHPHLVTSDFSVQLGKFETSCPYMLICHFRVQIFKKAYLLSCKQTTFYSSLGWEDMVR